MTARLVLNVGEEITKACEGCSGKGVEPHPELAIVLGGPKCLRCGGSGSVFLPSKVVTAEQIRVRCLECGGHRVRVVRETAEPTDGDVVPCPYCRAEGVVSPVPGQEVGETEVWHQRFGPAEVAVRRYEDGRIDTFRTADVPRWHQEPLNVSCVIVWVGERSDIYRSFNTTSDEWSDALYLAPDLYDSMPEGDVLALVTGFREAT